MPLVLLATAAAGGAASADSDALGSGAQCAAGFVLASGPPDPSLFAPEASLGVRAEWCERYDTDGRSRREGRYREHYADGALRTETTYVDGRLEGPVLVRDEEGRVFLRGRLVQGAWEGAFSLHHENGSPWLEATYVDGRLDGPLLLRHPDGALSAESHFARGQERGLARSFYPASHGGGLLSEVRIVGEGAAGEHRLFDDEGTILAPLDVDHPLFATVERGAARPVERPAPADRAPTAIATPSPVAAITRP